METMLGNGHASLAQTLKTQYKGLQEEAQVRERTQINALVTQSTTTQQVLTEVQNIKSQIEALSLEKLMIGFVLA